MTTEQQLHSAITAIENLVAAQQQFSADWSEYNAQLNVAISSIVDSKLAVFEGGVNQTALDSLKTTLQQADAAMSQSLTVAYSQADSVLAQSITEAYTQAIAQLNQTISQSYTQADISLEQTLRNSLASLASFTAAVNQLRDDVRKSGSANNSMMQSLPFNHDHSTHLKYQISNTRPLTRAKSAGLIHIDIGMSDLWFSKGYELDDWVKLDKSIGRRKFLVLESQHYIALDEPYTGSVTIRVWPFQSGSNGLPSTTETNALTYGSWQEITFSVTNLEQLFRDGTSSVTYFFGLVDFVRFDQDFESMDRGSTRLSALGGSIRKTTGWIGSPLLTFTLENDGYWYSDDLTNGEPDSVGAGWSRIGNTNTYTCTSLDDSSAVVKSISNVESEGKTLEFAMRVTKLSGVLATTVSNDDRYRIYTDGTYRFTVTNEDLGLKRAFGPLSCTVEILSARIKVDHS